MKTLVSMSRWLKQAVCKVGPKWQKTSKNWIEKFVKLTGHIYSCNNLTNSQYEAHKYERKWWNLILWAWFEKFANSQQVPNLILWMEPMWYVWVQTGTYALKLMLVVLVPVHQQAEIAAKLAHQTEKLVKSSRLQLSVECRE